MRNHFVAVLAFSIASTPVLADTVEMVAGDLLHGKVVEQSDQAVIIEHPVLGRIEVPLDHVQAVLITSKSDEDVLVTAEPQEEPVLDDDSLSQQLLPGWDKHLEMGVNGSDGNSETFNLNSAFTAAKEDEFNRSKITAKYFRNQDDGNRTRNEFTLSGVHDWLRPGSPWFTFSTARYQYDEFQAWKSRTRAFVGVGKVILESPKHKLTGRVGIGAAYEFGEVDELIPEALLGLQWVYQINDQQKLESYVAVLPDLDETGESNVLAGAAWTIKIDQADGVSLKFGVENEYESTTVGTAKHNDVKYYGALVFDF